MIEPADLREMADVRSGDVEQGGTQRSRGGSIQRGKADSTAMSQETYVIDLSDDDDSLTSVRRHFSRLFLIPKAKGSVGQKDPLEK